MRTGHNTVKSSSPNVPSTDSSPLLPVPTLPHKLATILAVQITVVAALSQCLCSEALVVDTTH